MEGSIVLLCPANYICLIYHARLCSGSCNLRKHCRQLFHCTLFVCCCYMYKSQQAMNTWVEELLLSSVYGISISRQYGYTYCPSLL